MWTRMTQTSPFVLRQVEGRQRMRDRASIPFAPSEVEGL